MIVNNYTNELREHKETDMSFHARICPQIFVRKFKDRIPASDGVMLTIPYFIVDGDDRRKCGNNDTMTFTEDLSATYTTIIKLDEHLHYDNGMSPRTWKRTSFGGEQVIEIGPFSSNDEGVHFLSLQCVNEYGVGSYTSYFKILVENSDNYVVDLDEIQEFSGSFKYSESQDQSQDTYIDTNQNNTLTNPSTRFLGELDSSHSQYVVKSTIVADYHVEVKRNGDVVDEIIITVSDGVNRGNSTLSDKGFIYKYDVQSWEKRYLNKYATLINTRPHKKEDISGIYKLRFFYNGTPLSYYLQTPPGELMQDSTTGFYEEVEGDIKEVRRIAANNKIALTRLMEAARAFASNLGHAKCTLKLPKAINIVTDLHAVKEERNQNQDNIVQYDVWYKKLKKPWSPYNKDSNKYSGGSFIEFPDNFTLDLNKGQITSLQVNDMSFSVVVPLSCNFNTHVKNGGIYGTYKYYDINYTTSGVGSTEWTGNTTFWGCDFCSFENCDLGYCLGYDAGIENNEDYEHRSLRTESTRLAMPYNGVGYVDYNGEKHITEAVSTDTDSNFESILRSTKILMRTTEGGENTGIRQGSSNTQSTYLKDRITFHSHGDYFWGPVMDMEKGSNAERGFFSKLEGRECFVHFYNSERQFIKTAKVCDAGPVLIPEDAEYVGYSSFGANSMKTKSCRLMWYGGIWTYGQPFLIGHKHSWCSGYRNCTIHDDRSCMFDNKNTNQCFFENCITWNIAAERTEACGGFSTQNAYIDIEESVRNDNFFVSGCDNLFGRRGVIVHNSNNICFENNHNLNLLLLKNVYGAQIYRHWGLLRETIGFSCPKRYHQITNNTFTTYRFCWDLSEDPETKKKVLRISDDGRIYMQNCTADVTEWHERDYQDAEGRYPKLFTNRCKFHLNKLNYNN